MFLTGPRGPDPRPGSPHVSSWVDHVARGRGTSRRPREKLSHPGGVQSAWSQAAWGLGRMWGSVLELCWGS